MDRTTGTRTTRSGTKTQTPIRTRRAPATTSRPRVARAPPYPEDDVEGRFRVASWVTLCLHIASHPTAPRSTTGASSRAAPAHRVNSFLNPTLHPLSKKKNSPLSSVPDKSNPEIIIFIVLIRYLCKRVQSMTAINDCVYGMVK